MWNSFLIGTSSLAFFFSFALREDEENLRMWYAKTPCRRKRHRNAETEEVILIRFLLWRTKVRIQGKGWNHSFWLRNNDQEEFLAGNGSVKEKKKKKKKKKGSKKMGVKSTKAKKKSK